MRSRELLAGAGLLAIVLWFAMPATPWEFDELLFMQGVQKYEPLQHHPPPPGYPLFMIVAKAARLLFDSAFTTIVRLNFIASIATFVLLALAFGRMADDLAAGVIGAALFSFSPAMIVHSTLALSDAGAFVLLAAALYVRNPALFGAFAALSIGWRPQFAILVAPLLLLRMPAIRDWRQRAMAVGAFTVVCIAWLVPLAVAVGGVDRLIAFETSQAGYLAQHDADVSRSGWTMSMVALRFVAHPFGTKVMSIPLLLLAAAGVVRLIVRRDYRVLPFAVAAFLYLVFALRFMDPADGVRYALPSVLATAFLAGVGVRWRQPLLSESVGYAAALLYAISSMIYVSPIISQRAHSTSPPVRAAHFANSAFPQSAVVLYELPLWPHAQVFFANRERMRVNDGLEQYFDRPDVPLFLYADGISRAPGARTFRWQPSDAYSKLTRNHYRVVSIVAIPPERRFRAIRGVNVPEREPDGEEWRWLDSPAELQLPPDGPGSVTMRVGLPVIYPMEVNTLTIYVNGKAARSAELRRGQAVDLTVAVPAGAPVIRFEAAHTFVPARWPGSLNRDPRRIAVKLYDLETNR